MFIFTFFNVHDKNFKYICGSYYISIGQHVQSEADLPETNEV